MDGWMGDWVGDWVGDPDALAAEDRWVERLMAGEFDAQACDESMSAEWLEHYWAANAEPDDVWDALPALGARTLLEVAAANRAAAVQAENRMLIIAAQWADRNPGSTAVAATADLRLDRAIELGGDGTPQVAESCAAEFGAVQGLSRGQARQLIADALDLRHRLPRLWMVVCSFGVEGWQARKIAQSTHSLSSAACRQIDEALDGVAGQLGWGRLQDIVTTAICDADPAQAEQRATQARRAKGVWSGRADELGLKSIFARTDAGSATWLMATVNRVADILAAEGDADSIDHRRAKSLAILAQPARALELLSAHASDPDECDGSAAGFGVPDGLATHPADTIDPDDVAGWAEPEESDRAEPDDVELPDPAEPAEPGHGWTEIFGGSAQREHLGEHDDHRSLRVGTRAGSCTVQPTRPTLVLHFHLSEETVRAGASGIVRPDDPEGGPVTVDQLRELAREWGCAVRIQPVIDPAQTASVDAYEIPRRLRRAVRYRDIAEVFPYGVSRRPGLDLDHTDPFDPGGPPGQTSYGNLGPLTRSAHRAKTVGLWHARQPEPGTFVWRSPHSWTFLVTNQGTIPLGAGDFGDAVWQLVKERTARCTLAA